ncbi:pyrroloquinoline quinone biosynthesis peptide chaperone PqqD [Neobacillus sp. MER 74]|uniref:pyrroloquinoline quinone biosynthesis peptide chaperone PqqD n=1 Tax=Neobacillus sp. MER 74 TaxID=2939566 RepID=UPI00203CCB19|nr:pyrroloquinoline quinone biosynthesis peptide chaperone PqqD [Neobacillus sp. MER 74]MCM3115354.1 pyrroloquinoline quinone biosynthesis peptide chaperone PqqD [Neobacillus sp. MER 74]
MVESILADSIPRLAAKARLKFDKVREKNLLLLPEKVVVLNETAATILTLCDGRQTVNTITEKIRASLKEDTENSDISALPDLKTMKADISEFLREMEDQGWVVIHKHGSVDNKE